MPNEFNEPTESEINDWNIHNDHQDDNRPEDVADETQRDTFRIRAGKLDFLTRKFEKIQKRAKRIGCVPPRFEILTTEDVPERVSKPEHPKADAQGWVETGRIIRWHDVKLIGERPILAGHKFIGTLEHNSEIGIVLRTVPGEAIPVEYRNADASNCDHCHKRITTRKETFIVEHLETKTFKQVGRQCVADFLGGTDPHAVLALVEMLSELSGVMAACEADDDEDYDGPRGKYQELYDAEHVLALTSALIRNCGWVPKSKAVEFGKQATAGRASDFMSFRGDKKEFFRSDRYGTIDYEEMAKYETVEADYEVAEKAIEWARALPDSGKELNDYLFNLYQIAKAGAFEPKHFGLACSIVPAYNRERERLLGIEREKKQFAASTHFGEVGKREQFILTVTRHSTFEGNYGVTHILGFQDRAGNFAIWFGNGGGMETGHTYRVKATVKDHGLYKEIKQTVLTRVSVEDDLTDTPESEWEIKPAKKAPRKQVERPELTDDQKATARGRAAFKAWETRRANRVQTLNCEVCGAPFPSINPDAPRRCEAHFYCPTCGQNPCDPAKHEYVERCENHLLPEAA